MAGDRTALYRHYDADGALLYVGVSISAAARTAQHIGGSHWGGEIAKIEVKYFSTREEALAAERSAIETERPLHNVVHGKANKVGLMDDSRPYLSIQGSAGPLPPSIDIKAMRKYYGLTQQSFAETFGVPTATLRDWEQGRRAPDAPGRALMLAIARGPATVARLLAESRASARI